MSNERSLVVKTEEMINDLKTICSHVGLGNDSSEYKIITEIFLYKYLNDKFLYEIKNVAEDLSNDATPREVEQYLDKLSPSEYSILMMQLNPNVARIRKEYMVSYLFNNKNTNTPEFYELFDNALVGISNDNMDIFSVKTGSGKEKIKLFDSLSQYIIEIDNRNPFFKAIIDKLADFSFEKAFQEKYDFFSTIFEYLIKGYNKDFGKYAEYYTPNSIARIIARILVPEPVQNVSVYDPAAGSGTLVLALAHEIGEDNCTIYTQDISQKSNEFLRLNLILNNLVHSLGNVIHGDTLTQPAHLNEEKNGLAQFDYIVSNPPFKMDFSDNRDILDDDKYNDRFFAGIPNIPNKDKDKMAIYLVFFQHILYSLKANKGKAAIVVPTGFLTGQSSIEKTIREYIISKKMLKGVISMPSNIFATTGTNVSIVFIDSSKENDKAVLIDATSFGYKTKEMKIQKTILSKEEIEKIVNIFNNKEVIEDISAITTNEKIIENSYSFSPAQYFDIKMDNVVMTTEEFNQKIYEYKEKLTLLNHDSTNLIESIIKEMEDLNYGK